MNNEPLTCDYCGDTGEGVQRCYVRGSSNIERNMCYSCGYEYAEQPPEE